MKTAVKRLYEGMFLVDSVEAEADWEGVNKTIKSILEKSGAEIVSIRKWDERLLAYGINGKERGTYILSYFNLDGSKIQEIERDVQLSQRIMRVLILNAEHMSNEDIEKETPAMRAERRLQQLEAAAAEKAEQKQQDEPDLTGETKETGETEETKESQEPLPASGSDEVEPEAEIDS